MNESLTSIGSLGLENNFFIEEDFELAMFTCNFGKARVRHGFDGKSIKIEKLGDN